METNNQVTDMAQILGRLVKEKKFILVWCAASIVAALVVAFSIPKEYKAGAKLAPEYTNRSSITSLSSLMGLSSSGLTSGSTRDAVYPELYPDIIESVPFLVGLFDVPVTVHDTTTTLYDYMLNYQKHPWWSSVLSLPFKAISWGMGLFHEKTEIPDDAPVDVYRMNRKQMYVASALRKRITVLVDKKTYVVTLVVKMQDPVIVADVASKVLDELQHYITDYRTEKSRQNLQYTQELYDAAMSDYFEKQQTYAEYMDSHQSLSSMKAKTEQERLQNDLNLSYQLYSRMAQQLQAAQAKVLEETPVFQVMQGPSVPIKKYKPSRSTILLVFLMLGLCISCSWVLFGREFFQDVKDRRKSE